MNTADKNGGKELKEYLSGNSAVSRGYKQHATDEPSAAVDDAIRAAAKREANAAPRHIMNPFGRHWSVPASLAAMLLLSVGLVIFMSDETGVAPFSSDMLEEVTEHDLVQPAVRQDLRVNDKAASPAPSSYGAAARRLEKKEKRTKPTAPASGLTERKRLRSETTSKAKQKSRLQREPADSSIMAPELWLAQIKSLRAQGKTKEAETSLAEFRKIYPDYPLDSLRK